MFGFICLCIAFVCEFWAAFINPSITLGGSGGLVLLLVPLGLMFLMLAMLVGVATPLWNSRQKQG